MERYWNPWTGGDCPVGHLDLVEVIVRCGDEYYPRAADGWDWAHKDRPEDIVAYRVLVEAK